MAEEKREKKKPGIIKRIFGWIWLGLLTLLILGALVYDAPWKVIALLLIILAASTILPKGTGKWFWLTFAAVVVILIIWVFLPDETEGWRPYTFEKELATLQAKYAVPDSENAALLYDKIFESLDIDSNQPKFFAKSSPSSTSEPWLSKDHPETAEWLKGHQKTIDTLMEISRIEKCRFSITTNPADTERWEHLQKMKRCAFLLLSAANNDMAEGRTDSALEKYLCDTRIAKHLYQQQTMLDFMVGFAVESSALTHLNRFMIEGEPSKEQLQLIANSIKDLENNWSSDFSRWLNYDKLLCKNMFSFWYEINQKAKVRLSRSRSPAYWKRKLTKASTILGWFFFPSTPQKLAKIVDATYEKYYAMADPNFDWNKEPGEVQPQFKLNYHFIVEMLTNMSGQAHSRVHELYLRHLAGRRGSRLLAAISQYKIENNAWPASLDVVKSLAPAEALIDPVSGKQFEYENHGKRFSLYGETANIWPK